MYLLELSQISVELSFMQNFEGMIPYNFLMSYDNIVYYQMNLLMSLYSKP